MKTIKKNYLPIAIISAVILSMIIVLFMVMSFNADERDNAFEDSASEENIEIVESKAILPEDIDEAESDEDEYEKDEVYDVLAIEEPEIRSSFRDTSSRIPAQEPDKPITRVDSSNEYTSDGIVTGLLEEESYDCGYTNHHCDGPETHAYIMNLELEGCPFCKSSNCPSFYATDEWGYICYTPSKCPSYDIHLDPVYYCQECGKPCGDGTGGSCVQFVNDCVCPNCGEPVSSWTCHSCK